MLTAILALGLIAADLWRRGRAFKQRIDAFLEWHTYDDGTRRHRPGQAPGGGPRPAPPRRHRP